MSDLVYGVGVNDADYVVSKEAVVNGNRKHVSLCPFYSAWRGMLDRCYNKNRTAKNKTYEGCTVCENWLTFSKFKEWMEKQDWRGKHLDKDIIIKGNKVYCPEHCAFVSGDLNAFLNSNPGNAGSLPTGVSKTPNGLRYQAYCRNPFTKKREYLGSYDDPVLAHEAWRKKKNELANKYADMQIDGKVEMALRKRFAVYD